MNCLIVDDHEIFRAILKKLLVLDNTLALVGECQNAIEAHQYISVNHIDLIFLDIEMPGMTGLELAKILEGQHPLIIFTTSNREHAVDAFELNVVDYLIKPVSPPRFLKAVQKAREIFSDKAVMNTDTDSPDFFFIRDSNAIRRVNVNDILYFEATGDYVKVVFPGYQYSIHSSLKTIEPKLPQRIFLRVHRSFIVNLRKIDSVEGKTLVIQKHLIPVSNAYRTDLNNHMHFL